MFTSTLFTAILASTAVLLSHADAAPNAPGPGDLFTVGGQCTLGWGADPDANPVWKNMTIELMTGSNEKMVHLTTVATNQDGTVDGTFSYTCPDVSPPAAVYFYQFTACGADTTQWTGRFIITGADGSTVAPTQSEFFDHTTEVYFGTATMATAAAATAAPVCNAAASGGAAASGASFSASSAPAVSNSLPSSASAAASGLSTSRSAGSAATGLPSSASSASGSAPSATGSSAALAAGPLAVGTGLWSVVAALSASAMAFTILL